MKSKNLIPWLLACSAIVNGTTHARGGFDRHRSNKPDLTKVMQLKPEMRTAVKSPWFHTDDSAVDFVMTYNGWDILKSERIRHRGISAKAKDMIIKAKKSIVASVFLFDNMYGSNEPEYNVVNDLTNLLIKKKKDNPEMNIVVILDPLNRAYSRRVSPSVQKFVDNGIDVYYSDLLPTKAATSVGFIETVGHVGRVADGMTVGLFGTITNGIASLLNIPGKKLDGHNIDFEVAFGASLMKANHRKILVTDVDGSEEFETLVTSANPHNASDDSTNTGLTVKGDLAKYVYGVLREDAAHSLRHQGNIPLQAGPKKYAMLSEQNKEKYKLPGYKPKMLAKYMSEVLPPVDFDKLDKGNEAQKVKSRFVSEIEVKNEVIRLLEEAKSDDVVRIQMFYLSDPDVVKTIEKVGQDPKRADNKIRLLLDPSKDAFNSIKDGTPNRQVAHYLTSLKKNLNVDIRWYSTHGEQNHAKIMSITNAETGKYEIITGSTNWTGKNMNNINMEANLTVVGSQRITDKFNNIFDTLWFNKDAGVLYTWDYSAYNLKTTRNLVEGYKVVEKWDEEKRAAWIQRHKKEIESIFLKKNAEQVSIMSEEQKAKWLETKFAKDKSSVMRMMSYIVGSAVVGQDDTEKKRKKWEKKYMKRWTKGEKWGYVSW
jgi:hypothetical protein